MDNGIHQNDNKKEDAKIDMDNDECNSLSSSNSSISNTIGENESTVSSSSDDLNLPGPLQWLRQQMRENTNPQNILKMLLPMSSPSNLSNYESWDMILQLLTQPLNKRKKLSHLNTMDDFVQLLKRSQNIIILTGAGVSVSCGIPDFRSKDGLYARLSKDFPNLPDPQAIFDINYFRYDPRPFFKIAKEIYPGKFKPSLSHRFIRYLEKRNKLLRNYTQNIDTLENVAGIKRIIECHGSFATASCTECKHQLSADAIKNDVYNQIVPLCPICHAEGKEVINLNPLHPGHKSNDELSKKIIADNLDGPKIVSPFKDNHTLLKDYHKDMSLDEDEDGFNTDDSSDEFNDYCFEKGHRDANHNNTTTKADGKFGKRDWAIMKPDIVFFGEGLGEKFHESLDVDKDLCDLLIVMGSSMKVRPVSLIPNSLPADVPQILINKEPLSHLNFDIEFLGDCDTIIAEVMKRVSELTMLPNSNGARETQHPSSSNQLSSPTSSNKRDINDVNLEIEDNHTLGNKKVRHEPPFKDDDDITMQDLNEEAAGGGQLTEIYIFDHVYKHMRNTASQHEKTSTEMRASSIETTFENIVAWDETCHYYLNNLYELRRPYFENVNQHEVSPLDLPPRVGPSISPPTNKTTKTFVINMPPPVPLLLVKKKLLEVSDDQKIHVTSDACETDVNYVTSIKDLNGNVYLSPAYVHAKLKDAIALKSSPRQKIYALSCVKTTTTHDKSPASFNADDVTLEKFEEHYLTLLTDSNGNITQLPDRTYLYIPPNRLLFPEAEIKRTSNSKF